MDNMNQQLILMSEAGKPIGFASREECHRGAGRLHWGYILLLHYPDGKFLLTRRADTKKCGAGLWDASVVSHVLSGETLFEAIERRAREEVSISISKFTNLGAFVYTASYGEYSENEYCSVVVGSTDQVPDPNPEEISEIRFLNFVQLQDAIKAYPKTFAPWLTIPVKQFEKELKNSA